MSTRAQNNLLSVSDRIASLFDVLPEDLAIVLKLQALTVSHLVGHLMPNMAALVLTVVKGRNVSQVDFGRNVNDDGEVLFAGFEHILRNVTEIDGIRNDRPIWTVDYGYTKKGYHSYIAHIVQGKSRPVLLTGFAEYLAGLLGISVSDVEAAYAEDVAIWSASVS